ncbi:MAG: septum formation protein Maf [Chloroflexi bacterium]|nr:MAG: septum formation protein Maf [Chloroflexota bacterium]
MTFILASGSPRRRQLLAELGISPQVIKPDIPEVRQKGETPLQYVRRLSIEKAEAVVAMLGSSTTDVVILAADTTVILAADTIGIETDGQILEKPVDADDARRMLRRLRNRPHQVCTAFTLLKIGDQPQRVTEVVCTTVYMRDYTDDEIEVYIASGDPFDKAGAYAIQNEDFAPVARIEGSYTNVVGLPLEAVEKALKSLGWPLSTQ